MDDPYAFLEEPDLSVGTFLSESLQVMDLLGEGAFGHVTKCFSTKTGEMEAVKIIKKFPGLPVEKNEVVILEQLRSLDPDTSNIIKWKESFTYQDHMCMSYELLDQDLQNYVKARGEGLLIPDLKSVIRQVATALQHLRSFKIVHADIRPENIMIVDRRQQPIRVRLVDFGLSFQIGDRPFFQATGYRAPEVLLGIHPLTEAIDIWSTGATLVEVSHGQPSDEILDRGKDTASYFCEQDKNLFADLLKRMMQLDQDERITPLEVLQHPFLNESSPQGLLENNAVSLPGPDEHCRDVSLESSSRQPGAQEGDSCVIEIPSLGCACFKVTKNSSCGT
uniref:Protein kinase domain-containing protein n=1 Tax=Takifugu rubripes TaxID=31033 RepID=A0A3B5K9Z6_TAKRU